MINLFKHTFLNFYNFSGRANRKEVWNYCILSLICMYLLIIFIINIDYIDNVTGGNSFNWVIKFINSIGYTDYILAIIILIFCLPYFALYTRRLHDLNLSGWLLFIGLIPILRLILWIILLFIKGQEYPNKYGPIPKYENI